MSQVAESSKKKGGDGSTLAAVLNKKDEVIPFEVQEEERLPGSRVRFKLKMQEEAIANRLEDTLKEFGKQVRVPGFRPGKAPKNLIRKSYEQPAREETVKRMVQRLSDLYVAKNNIEVLSQPYLLSWSSTADAGTVVELALEIHPDVKVDDATLGDITAHVHNIKIDDDYVEKRVQRLREQNATYQAVDDAAYEPKDGALVTCLVTDAYGDVLQDRCAEKYYTTKVEDEMPEQVAAALVGKKKGERVVLEIEEDSEFEPGTKETIHYNVELLEVKKRNLPELDDEFAKDVNGQFASLEDLRKSVRDGAAAEEEMRQRDEALAGIYDTLRERLDFDLPRGMVENTANKSISDMEHRLNGLGMSLRTMDEQIIRSYAASIQEQARTNVKNYLIMRQLAKQLNVTPTEAQINEALDNAAKQSGRKAMAIRAQLEAKKQWDQFVQDLTLKLTNDQVLTKAKRDVHDITIGDFEKMQREKQEAQAAKLRGEQPAHDHEHHDGCDHDHDHGHKH
ncbi:trigger factor [Candidatus Sumerlaeota bacterium]|nr:trigger factor [Candidatus Sumerlaeota bacterium]